MSLQQTKIDFGRLIDDRDNRVLAVSGKWGTGKSEMWKQVKSESNSDAIRKSLYVSLFGIKDIPQLKARIVQSEIPDSKMGHLAKELTSSVWSGSKKVLKSMHAGFAALDDVALLAIPALLRNRLLVIDDVERKHANLGIDEVMGFIDEFTQMYGSRIVLILNSDQLEEKDKGLWDKLREKVIDHELGVETTPREAFEIASGHVASPHAEHILKAVETCAITNIRILQKIIRVVNGLLGGREDLTLEVLDRTVPSTVLLCAIHYRGLDEGPPLEFVMGFNAIHFDMEEAIRRPGSMFQEVPERPAVEKEWGALLNALKIVSCDEYERMVQDFLKSGLFDEARTKAILDDYVSQKNGMAFKDRFDRFVELEQWHPETPDSELIALARELLADTRWLDAYTATALHDKLADLDGGQEVAQDAIDAWLSAFLEKDPPPGRPENYDNLRLHPAIEAAFVEAESRARPAPSLLEACIRVGAGSTWNDPDMRRVRSATDAEYEQTIRTISGVELRDFLRANVHLYARREAYAADLDGAPERFASACRSICASGEPPRLGKAIKRVFRESGLDWALSEKADEAEPAGLPIAE